MGSGFACVVEPGRRWRLDILAEHGVRNAGEGAIRISESLAADVLTGYPGRPGTAPADARGGAADGGAAGPVVAFPAQFRGRPTRAA